ncbi:predicted protein, partial [Postia placenta Mad-698-R]
MSTTAAIPTPNRSRPRSRLNSLKSLGSGDDLPRFPFGGSKRSPSQGRPPSSYVGPLGPPEPDEHPHVSVFRKSPARFYWTQVTARVQGDSRSRQVGFTTPECNRHSATAQMEGVFVHISSPPEGPEIPAKMRAATSTMHRHAFLSTTQALPIDKTLGPRRSSSRLREAIAATTRPRRERRPSQTSISGILRPFPFSIEVPPSARPGAELPQTFCAAADGLAGTRARAFVERSEIMYKLIATWETDDGTDEMSVGAPIILEPDPEFESLDGRNMLPSIDWEDLNVKYFLEVSVVFGQDETRARVPIRVLRHQIYSIPGKLPNLGDFITAGCRYGGPLALMRDTTKLVALGRATPSFAKAQIQIYSSAGEGILWDQGKIIRFGWTGDERLVVLNEEGAYRLYDLQGDYEQYSLGSEAAEMGVLDARIHENGIVALTGSLTLVEVRDWAGGKPLTLANSGLTQPPHSWAVIPPDLTISRHVEVLMSVESTIYSVDNLESIDQQLSRGPFTHLAPSPNGKSLALLTYSGLLWVVSTDFQRSLAEFNTANAPGAEGEIRQVEWCGNDAVLVTWDTLALLVGPFGDTLQYFYSGPTFAVTESDGIRLVGPDSCDFVQKVPVSSVSVFRPGSTSPSAILYDAWENFTRRSPKADESIRNIRPELGAAVNECIDAAGREWEPVWQRRLLSAAKFGQAFLDLYDPTDLVQMGQALK